MADAQEFETVYVTATAPVDKAGNFYTPALIPQGVDPLPANVTKVAPTADQIAAGKPLKFDWANQFYVESGEDPTSRALAALAAQYATDKAADNAKIAALGQQLAVALAKTAAPAATDDKAADTGATDAPKEA